MTTNTYYVYEPKELINKLDSFDFRNKDVDNFFQNFTFENNVKNQHIAKGNSSKVFNNLINEDTTKAKIIFYLNKLNQSNLSKIVSSIREIVFQTTDELNELVYQCIKKIKMEKDDVRPLVAGLCWELATLYFETSSGEKIHFRKLLLTEVKNEYTKSIQFESNEWSRDISEKVMILIGTFYNGKIIDNNIMKSILKDLIDNIVYVADKTQEYYDKVEKSIQLLSFLVASVVLNDESKEMFSGLDKFLNEQITKYEEVKCISKKTRLVCKNIIFELTKQQFN
jgi:hypothetical protein